MQRNKLGLTALAIALVAMPLGGVLAESDSYYDRFAVNEDVSRLPEGCTNDQEMVLAGLDGESPVSNFLDNCYHMRGDLNALDSPIIDVLLIVKASPYAERELRIMQQVVHMYEAGFEAIAAEEGLDWLADGVEFHVSVDTWDGTGEFTTYPIVDPEIVVISSNPATYGAFSGIGIDATAVLFGENSPCHGIQNPFDHGAWEALPGFDSHHDGRGGTYREDCDGAGGNVCFAINAALDVVPGVADSLLGVNLYDLVAHEIGHCLRLGHVGDALDHKANAFPPTDIMSYADLTFRKCVSSLDLETFATAMSPYLDVNGDGTIDEADRLFANDRAGDHGGRSDNADPFQVQLPSNHYYASPSGRAEDCPQPEEGIVPVMEFPNFNPGEIQREFATVTIEAPSQKELQPGMVTVSGSANAGPTGPRAPQADASVADPDDEVLPAHHEILGFRTNVSRETIDIVIELRDLAPSNSLVGTAVYGVWLGGYEITSHQMAAPLWSPDIYDSNAENGYLDPDQGTVEWDSDANTIHFQISLEHLATRAENPIELPFTVSVEARGSVALTSLNTPRDIAPNSESDIPMVGPSGKHGTVELTLKGAKSVEVPVIHGQWAGNLELPEGQQSPVLEAVWLAPDGSPVASDFVTFQMAESPEPESDDEGLENATVDSTMEDSERAEKSVPGLGVVGALVSLLGVLAVRRTTRR